MATRLASEKGVEVLLDALPRVLELFPGARVLFAGQHERVWGEQEYADRLRPRIEAHRTEGRWTYLGVLTQEEMVPFFQALDVLVVPSLNSTESFGLVQIEAMMKGVPSVASDLPGVRQPVRMTGIGEVVPVGDADALATALIRVLERPNRYARDPVALAQRFHPDRTAAAYESLFEEIRSELGQGSSA
jgi:glycosyltransferase involved in cell wall biosynthesis